MAANENGTLMDQLERNYEVFKQWPEWKQDAYRRVWGLDCAETDSENQDNAAREAD